jgi:hypothetical protein
MKTGVMTDASSRDPEAPASPRDLNSLKRREFLRKAALTGATMWAIPVVESLRASPAFAGTLTPCDWSTCIGLCAATGNKKQCGQPPRQVCQDLCSRLCGGHPPHQCTCSAACCPAFWPVTINGHLGCYTFTGTSCSESCPP